MPRKQTPSPERLVMPVVLPDNPIRYLAVDILQYAEDMREMRGMSYFDVLTAFGMAFSALVCGLNADQRRGYAERSCKLIMEEMERSFIIRRKSR